MLGLLRTVHTALRKGDSCTVRAAAGTQLSRAYASKEACIRLADRTAAALQGIQYTTETCVTRLPLLLPLLLPPPAGTRCPAGPVFDNACGLATTS
jgi:hypothetical protein